MVDEIDNSNSDNRESGISGVIAQLSRTERNTSRRERKQLAAIKESNEILTFLYDATQANIEVNQEAVDAQRLAELEKKEQEQEAAKQEKLKAQLGLKDLQDGAGKLVKNKGFQAALAATIIGILAIEEVQIFVQEKLIPIIQKFITYMTTVAVPFMIDNFDKIMIGLGTFVSLTVLVNIITKIGVLMRTATKVWSAVTGSIILFNNAIFETNQGIKGATTALKLSRGAIGALGAAATFLTAFAMPSMIDALGLTGATLVSSAVGLGVALLPLIAINAKVAGAIAIVAGLITLIGLHFNKMRETLGVHTLLDTMKIEFGRFLDLLAEFGNSFIDFGKMIGRAGVFIAGLMGKESEFFKNMAEADYFDVNNRQLATISAQEANRDRLVEELEKETDPKKVEQLFNELVRVEKLLEESSGEPAPKRDFNEYRVEKLRQDEHRLREELKKGTRASELALFQNIYDMSDNSSTSGGGSGGGTTFITGNTSPENQDTELLNAAGSGN
tara:strand:+ start:415 stop:1920 length:1506 start_codon:yes stop_codon:yes gene_type:complete